MSLEHLTAPQRNKGPQVLCARTQGSLNGLPVTKRWITGVSKKNPACFRYLMKRPGWGMVLYSSVWEGGSQYCHHPCHNYSGEDCQWWLKPLGSSQGLSVLQVTEPVQRARICLWWRRWANSTFSDHPGLHCDSDNPCDNSEARRSTCVYSILPNHSNLHLVTREQPDKSRLRNHLWNCCSGLFFKKNGRPFIVETKTLITKCSAPRRSPGPGQQAALLKTFGTIGKKWMWTVNCELQDFMELMLFSLSYDARGKTWVSIILFFKLSPDSKHQKLLKGNNSATFTTWSTDTRCLRINTD